MERRWIAEYEHMLLGLLDDLRMSNLGVACQLAELPAEVRGYDEVRRPTAEAAEKKRARLLEAFAKTS